MTDGDPNWHSHDGATGNALGCPVCRNAEWHYHGDGCYPPHPRPAVSLKYVAALEAIAEAARLVWLPRGCTTDEIEAMRAALAKLEEVRRG